MTAMLRGKFGLNSILSEGDTKMRDDHRHHAIDARGCCSDRSGMLQRFSKASAHAESLQLKRLVDEMPLPWKTFREQVVTAVASVKTSHKPDHGYQGQMHEDSAWGFAEDGLAVQYQTDESTGLRGESSKKEKLNRHDFNQ